MIICNTNTLIAGTNLLTFDINAYLPPNSATFPPFQAHWLDFVNSVFTVFLDLGPSWRGQGPYLMTIR